MGLAAYGMCNLPGSGIEPVSIASAGRFFFFFFNIYLFFQLHPVSVAARGIFVAFSRISRCGSWTLVVAQGLTAPQRVGYFLFFLATSWGTGNFPDQGLNPSLLHWKHSVLTTGPPRKSQVDS